MRDLSEAVIPSLRGEGSSSVLSVNNDGEKQRSKIGFFRSRRYSKHAETYGWKDYLLPVIFLVPNLILLIIFTYRPLFDNIRLSFMSWNISSTTATFVGLENYIEWFHSSTSWQILKNTVFFTFGAVVGSMVIGLLLAIVLDQKLFGRNAVRAIVFMPYILSGAAIGVAFQFIFDPNFGLISDILTRMGIAAPNFYQDPKWALLMVTFTYVWKNLGYTFIIYLAALQARRKDLDEAAEIDGASALSRFFKILLPQLRSTTFFLSITVLLNSMQVFDMINVMTRGGPQATGTTTMVYQVYQETFVNARAGYGATVATILFIILLVVTLFQVRYMQKGEQ